MNENIRFCWFNIDYIMTKSLLFQTLITQIKTAGHQELDLMRLTVTAKMKKAVNNLSVSDIIIAPWQNFKFFLSSADFFQNQLFRTIYF